MAVIVLIKEQSWCARIAARKLKSSGVALVLGRTVHLWNISRQQFLADRRLVIHELEHVRQFRQYGFLRFCALYLWESVRRGYYNNRFEIEARMAETTRSIPPEIYFR
jgi:hypothetical protein